MPAGSGGGWGGNREGGRPAAGAPAAAGGGGPGGGGGPPGHRGGRCPRLPPRRGRARGRGAACGVGGASHTPPPDPRLLVPPPDFHLIRAGKDAQSEGTKELLKEGRKLVAGYGALDPDSFLALLDWADLAVHNGDLDSRDNVGLRAIYDWTRDGVAFPALERWIRAGNDVDLLRRMGYDPEVPATTKLAQRKGELVRIGREARDIDMAGAAAPPHPLCARAPTRFLPPPPAGFGKRRGHRQRPDPDHLHPEPFGGKPAAACLFRRADVRHGRSRPAARAARSPPARRKPLRRSARSART